MESVEFLFRIQTEREAMSRTFDWLVLSQGGGRLSFFHTRKSHRTYGLCVRRWLWPVGIDIRTDVLETD
jgi:hypothetical protein